MKNFNRFLRGVADVLQLGENGGWLKYASSVFSLRNPADSANSRLKIAPARNSDEAVTLAQLLQARSPIIQGGFDGATPPAIIEGYLYMCILSGGVYTAGSMYLCTDGQIVPYNPADGQPLTFAVETIVQGGNTYFQDHIYICDSATSTLLDNGPMSTGYDDTFVVKRKFVNVTNTAGIQQILVPLNSVIRKVSFISNSAWVEGTGDLGDVAVRKQGGENLALGNSFDFSENSISDVNVFAEMGAVTIVEVVIPTGLTSGSGKVEVEFYRIS